MTQKIIIPYDIDRGVYFEKNINVNISVGDTNSCELIIPVGRKPFNKIGNSLRDVEFEEPLDLTGYSAVAYFKHQDEKFDLQHPLKANGNQLNVILPAEELYS